MKTLYLIPCALLAAAIALGAPSASASASASAKSFQMKFAHNLADAAPTAARSDLMALHQEMGRSRRI